MAFVTVIDENQCIGDSLPSLNTSLSALDAAVVAISAVPSLADGDKGDIVVSGNGSVWSVSTGSILQTLQTTYSTLTSTYKTIPSDDTIPQLGEGQAFLSGSITPTATANPIFCRVSVPYSTNSDIRVGVALFRVGVAGAIFARENQSSNSGFVHFEYLDSPASVSEQGYVVSIGNIDGASIVGVNSQASAATSRLYGGSSKATLTLQEVKG